MIGPRNFGSVSAPRTHLSSSGSWSIVPSILFGQTLPNGGYQFFVRACNGNSCSNWLSVGFVIDNSALSQLEIPTNLSVTPGLCGTNQVTLSWSPVPGATSYQLAKQQLGGGNSWGALSEWYGWPRTSLVYTGFPNEQFTFSIRAQSSSAESGFAYINGAIPPVGCNPIPAPTTPVGNTKSDRVLSYTISILQYVQRLLPYERNPIGPIPVPPAPQQF